MLRRNLTKERIRLGMTLGLCKGRTTSHGRLRLRSRLKERIIKSIIIQLRLRRAKHAPLLRVSPRNRRRKRLLHVSLRKRHLPIGISTGRVWEQRLRDLEVLKGRLEGLRGGWLGINRDVERVVRPPIRLRRRLMIQCIKRIRSVSWLGATSRGCRSPRPSWKIAWPFTQSLQGLHRLVEIPAKTA